jgi:hypothetical protein
MHTPLFTLAPGRPSAKSKIMKTTTTQPRITCTRDSEGVILASAYELECEGFYFHVQRFGRTWSIDGRDRDGLPADAFGDACTLIRESGEETEHRTLGAARDAILRMCA